MKPALICFALIIASNFAFSQETPKKSGKIESPKTSNQRTAPATINAEEHSHPPVKKAEVSPETKAKARLNTSTVPADFPRYDASKMDKAEYEKKVAEWCKNNPDKIRKND